MTVEQRPVLNVDGTEYKPHDGDWQSFGCAMCGHWIMTRPNWIPKTCPYCGGQGLFANGRVAHMIQTASHGITTRRCTDKDSGDEKEPAAE